MRKDRDDLARLREEYYSLLPKCLCGGLADGWTGRSKPILVCAEYPGCAEKEVPPEVVKRLRELAEKIEEIKGSDR